MLNEIMDAVTTRINEVFGDDYTIYTDVVEQGLKEPCFFVRFLEPSEKLMIGRRYFRQMDLCIQYLPGGISEVSKELNRVTELLMNGMEYITLADGSRLRGIERRVRPDLEEKILTFFVHYSLFVLKEQKTEEAMEAIKIEKGMVK